MIFKCILILTYKQCAEKVHPEPVGEAQAEGLGRPDQLLLRHRQMALCIIMNVYVLLWSRS